MRPALAPVHLPPPASRLATTCGGSVRDAVYAGHLLNREQRDDLRALLREALGPHVEPNHLGRVVADITFIAERFALVAYRNGLARGAQR